MCPRPHGWSDEQWRAHQDRRGGRMVLMSEYMNSVSELCGITLCGASRVMESEIYKTGAFNLEEGLDEATERWVTARKERYGY